MYVWRHSKVMSITCGWKTWILKRNTFVFTFLQGWSSVMIHQKYMVTWYLCLVTLVFHIAQFVGGLSYSGMGNRALKMRSDQAPNYCPRREHFGVCEENGRWRPTYHYSRNKWKDWTCTWYSWKDPSRWPWPLKGHSKMGAAPLDRVSETAKGWVFEAATKNVWPRWSQKAVRCGHRGWNVDQLLWHPQQAIKSDVVGRWRCVTCCSSSRFSKSQATFYHFLQFQWTACGRHSAWEHNTQFHILCGKLPPQARAVCYRTAPNRWITEVSSAAWQCEPSQGQGHCDLLSGPRPSSSSPPTLQSWPGTLRLLAFSFVEGKVGW